MTDKAEAEFNCNRDALIEEIIEQMRRLFHIAVDSNMSITSNDIINVLRYNKDYPA